MIPVPFIVTKATGNLEKSQNLPTFLNFFLILPQYQPQHGQSPWFHAGQV